MITVEKFDELYPKTLKGFGTKITFIGGAISYYSRAMTVLDSQVTVWWHYNLPEMAHIATVECSNPEVLEFVTDRIWEAR